MAMQPIGGQTMEALQGGLRGLGRRQAVCSQKSVGPDNAIFIAGMKDVIPQSAPTRQNGNLVSISSALVGQAVSRVTHVGQTEKNLPLGVGVGVRRGER